MIRPVTSSGRIDTGVVGAVFIGECYFHGATLTPGTTASSVLLTDTNAFGATSGTTIANLSQAANGKPISINMANPVYCALGISFSVSGTASYAVVYYSPIAVGPAAQLEN